MEVVKDRARRIAIIDLAVSVLALLCHGTALIYFLFIATREGYPFLFDNGFVEVIFWAVVFLVTPMRLLLVFSAYRLLQAVNRIETDSERVMDRLRFWQSLNCFMIFVYCLTLFQIFAVIYNCSVVWVSSYIQMELCTNCNNNHNNQEMSDECTEVTETVYTRSFKRKYSINLEQILEES